MLEVHPAPDGFTVYDTEAGEAVIKFASRAEADDMIAATNCGCSRQAAAVGTRCGAAGVLITRRQAQPTRSRSKLHLM